MALILVVDDNNFIRQMLRHILEGAGHRVVEAADGNEALKKYGETPTDLIITDLLMPDKDGIEIIMEIRRRFPCAKIIAISGGGQIEPRDYLELARELGALRTFTKPFRKEEMLAAISEVLGPRKSSDS